MLVNKNKINVSKKPDENQGFFVGDVLQKGYGILPNIILFDKKLSSTAKLLYCLTSSLCAEKGYCFASNSYLGEKLGKSKNNITKLIRELSKYLTIENPKSNKRRIFLSSTQSKRITNIIKNDYPNIIKNDEHNNINKNIINRINIPFETFWNLYDKKVGKVKCEKKWNKLKDEDRKRIIDYLPKYKKATPEKQYRKNPETFLNNRSWEDEIIELNKDEQGVVILHDGQKAVYKNGAWVMANDPSVKYDLSYYPELKNK